MAILFNVLYSLLFALLLYVVRFAIISAWPVSKRPVISIVLLFACILLMSHYYNHPDSMSDEAVSALLMMNTIGMIMFYVMSGLVAKTALSMQDSYTLKKQPVKGVFQLANYMRHTGAFFMFYILDILTIWKV